MRLELRGGLPYLTVTLRHGESKLDIANVLVDTGAVGCVFPTDLLERELRFTSRGTDIVHRLIGVGGIETVVKRSVDSIEIGGHRVLTSRSGSARWTTATTSMGSLEWIS